MKKGLVLVLIVSIFLINFVVAETVSDSLHLNIQVTNSSGIATGTFNFGFNISKADDCATSNIVYADAASLATDDRGIISHYLDNVNLNFSEQYWLCYYRNNALISTSKIARTPYSFQAKNTTTSGIIADADLNLGSYGLTTNNGWLNGGVSILDGDIYAQSLFVYNISSINVNNININGSLLPLSGWDNTFDIGSSSLRWKDLYLSGHIYSDGVGDNYFLGDLGIGTTSPTEKLNVVGNVNITGNISSYNFQAYDGITSVGVQTGSGNTGITFTAVGFQAGYNNGGDFSTMIGYQAGYSNTADDITAIGYQAGLNNVGDNLFALGYKAGYSNRGNYLTALGYDTGELNIGNYTIALGAFAGNSNTGNYVTAIGYQAGQNNIGNNSVFLGYRAGQGNTLNGQFIVRDDALNANPLIQGDFASGNVGIGTANPAYLLEIANNASAMNVSGVLYVDSTNELVGIGTPTSDRLTRIGGLIANGYALHISSDDLNAVRLTNTFSGLDSVFGQEYDTRFYTSAGSISNNDFVLKTNNIGRITITSNGKVGIGNVTTPSTTLMINSSGANGIDLAANSANRENSGELFFSNGTSGKSFGIVKTGSRLGFAYGATPGSGAGTPILYMTESGNVGIGPLLLNPTARLEISKGGYFGEGILELNVSGTLYVNGTSGSVGIKTSALGAFSTTLGIKTSGANDGIELLGDATNPSISGTLYFSNTTLGKSFAIYRTGDVLSFQSSATPKSGIGNVIMQINESGRASFGGSIRTGDADDTFAWNQFGTGTKGRAEINDSHDVYISGTLEVDANAFLTGGSTTSGAYWTVGDVAENMLTIEGRNNILCNKNGTSCTGKAYKHDELEFGDVVCIDPRYGQVIIKCNNSETDIPVGVISSTAKLIIGGAKDSEGWQVGVAGFVPTKVSNENGGIYPGDLLVLSETKPGYAMKKDGIKKMGGMILGAAYDFCDTRYNSECEIPILIALSYTGNVEKEMSAMKKSLCRMGANEWC